MPVRTLLPGEVEALRVLARTPAMPPDWKKRIVPGDRLIIEGPEVVQVTRIAWREGEILVQVTNLFGPMWVRDEAILGRAP